MDRLKLPFDYRKSTQALNFFATEAGGQINKMKALKLVFLADRYHLRKYGRLITNDSYVAMQHGPVPSTTKDIAESNDYLDKIPRDYSLGYIVPTNNLVLKSMDGPDISVFSKSDIEVLKLIWDTFGHYDQYQLRDITHTYPEWTRHKGVAALGSCAPMNVLDFLKDPVEQPPPELNLREEAHKTFDLGDEERQDRAEQLRESSAIEALWR